jgi:hypothetical protein
MIQVHIMTLQRGRTPAASCKMDVYWKNTKSLLLLDSWIMLHGVQVWTTTMLCMTARSAVVRLMSVYAPTAFSGIR